MAVFVTKIEAMGVHGRFDINQEFEDGVNIIYGINGAGKTTMLHILANALSGDFSRLSFLNFRQITIWLSNKKTLEIKKVMHEDRPVIEAKLGKKKLYRTRSDVDERRLMELNAINQRRFYQAQLDFESEISERQKRELEHYLSHSQGRLIEEIKPIVSVAYFPAFRTMIEAWVAAAAKKDVEPRRRLGVDTWKDIATERARDWFGGFTPVVNFPSLVDIEQQLTSEIERARMDVWKADQTLLSDAFLKIFASLSETSDQEMVEEKSLLASIQNLFAKLEQSPLRTESRVIYSKLRSLIDQLNIEGNTDDKTALRVLKIYRDALQSTLNVQEKSFKGIESYLSSVNEFLEGKSLVFEPDVSAKQRRYIQIRFNDGSILNGLRSLSSGERQIMTLVYAATHMSQQEIVLIDEPEISLHVDWQRMLVQKMAEQMGQLQIIACTHSPVIGANHADKVKEISLSPTTHSSTTPIDDEEIEL